MSKCETATKLELSDKVIAGGWRNLTARKSDRIGGLVIKRKRETKQEAMKGMAE